MERKDLTKRNLLRVHFPPLQPLHSQLIGQTVNGSIVMQVSIISTALTPLDGGSFKHAHTQHTLRHYTSPMFVGYTVQSESPVESYYFSDMDMVNIQQKHILLMRKILWIFLQRNDFLDTAKCGLAHR